MLSKNFSVHSLEDCPKDLLGNLSINLGIPSGIHWNIFYDFFGNLVFNGNFFKKSLEQFSRKYLRIPLEMITRISLGTSTEIKVLLQEALRAYFLGFHRKITERFSKSSFANTSRVSSANFSLECCIDYQNIIKDLFKNSRNIFYFILQNLFGIHFGHFLKIYKNYLAFGLKKK